MALRKFTPDPDLFDPEDPEGWYGTWEHDDGSSLYGQGTEEMGRPLMANPAAEQPDQRTAEFTPADARAWAAEGGQQSPRPPDETEQVLDAPPPLTQSKPAPVAPPAPAPAPHASEGSAWEDSVPPQVAAALHQNAEAAGLNPAALANIIQHESGWNPASVNAKTGKHAGLIQFSQDGWGQVAAAAGHPDVTWDQMKGMSAEEQIPFVVAYYKGKGLTPESGASDYAMSTFMPAYKGEGDDFVLGEKDSNEMRGDVRSGKVWEQNQGLDLNKDGKITKGEVGQAYGGKPGAPGAPRGTGGGMPPGGVPSSMGGLPLAAAEVQGVPLTPEQVQQRQQDVAQRYAAQAGGRAQADAARIQGKQEVLDAWNNEATKQATDASAREATMVRAKQEAEQKIDLEVNREIQKVDPGRLIKGMSTGSKVLGGIAILMSELGRGLMSLGGAGDGPNLALSIIMKRIDDDIDAQKTNIAGEQRASENRVAYWSKKLGNAEDGVSAARAEAHQAAGMMLQGKVMGSEIQDVKAQGMEYAAQLFGQAQQEVQAITDRESARLVTRYAVPAVPKGAKEKTLAESIAAAKQARQELELAGHPPAEVQQMLADNGIPYIQGDTVAQTQHADDQTHADAEAHQKQEAAADEDTSKELQPIAEAETMWRNALAKLDGLNDHVGVREKGYKPGGYVEGITSTWPGFPSVDEQNAFDQSITAATNAQIAALGRASDSDEDRIKHETIGGGDLKSYRRGIMNQLAKLEKKRNIVTARRAGAATRVEGREQQDTMPKVTGRAYVQGQGPLR
jgi:hypothetical protein